MQRRIVLRNACACALADCLPALAERARRRLGPNRRACPTLVALKVKEEMAPLSFDLPPKLEVWGLYSEPPNPLNPLGTRLLGVTAPRCGPCMEEPAAGCAAGPQEPGGELHLYITQLPEFPFSADEVDGFFYTYFGMHAEAAAVTPPAFRLLGALCRQLEAQAAEVARAELAAAGAAVAEASPPPPPPHEGPGAPLHPANAWLLEEMRRTPQRESWSSLKPEYRRRYLAHEGVAPPDWDKHFQQAARRCRERLAREGIAAARMGPGPA